MRERKPPPYPLAFQHFVERMPPTTCCPFHQEEHRRLLEAVQAPAAWCVLCGELGTWRGGWRPTATPPPVPTPCRDSVNEADLAVYYDLCEHCQQLPGTPAQVDSLMRQRQEALSGSEAAKLNCLLRQPQPCLLCGVFPADYNAIFKPDKPELYGGQRSKVRLMGYALCRTCLALPNVTLHVEGKLMADLAGRRN